MTQVTLSRVLKNMNGLIARKNELASALKEINATLTTLEAHALGMMGEETDSQKVEGRTWYKKTAVNFNIADGDLFIKWAIDNDNIDFLQKRLASTNVREFLESTGELPPGVNSFAAVKLGHRS